ncbi:F-box domain protein [Klosneuvirus KNV1]|uniref:F-box domain protein n=1 Tax=Klosneuvirus KNV1 TaxID=1977640 RepID=A0A1V0SLF8_9VIRU|nr:F-box domain protein [Klosneuvirus KNV1]
MNIDTLFEVFQYLQLKDLYSCMQVCDNFNQIINHDTIWKRIITSFLSQDTIQKLFTQSYKNTLLKYFYLLERFDWIYLINLEDKPHRFFKQNKQLAYRKYIDNEINGRIVTKYLPTSVDGYQFIPELSEKYLKLFRQARPDYMCLMTIHVYVKDESMIILIDSEVDEVFISIDEKNQYNIVGCMDEDDDDYNCYIASNDNAYYNTDNGAPLLFYGKYDFRYKDPVLTDDLLKHIQWYFDEGLKDIWH